MLQTKNNRFVSDLLSFIGTLSLLHISPQIIANLLEKSFPNPYLQIHTIRSSLFNLKP